MAFYLVSSCPFKDTRLNYMARVKQELDVPLSMKDRLLYLMVRGRCLRKCWARDSTSEA